MKNQIKIIFAGIALMLLAGCAKKTNLKALMNSKPELTVQKSENNVNVSVSKLPSKKSKFIPNQLFSHIKKDKYSILVLEIDNLNNFYIALKTIENDLMDGDFIYDKCKYNPFLRGSAGLLVLPVITVGTSLGMILSGAIISSSVGNALIYGGLLFGAYSIITLPIFMIGSGIGFGVYYNNMNENLKKEIEELVYYNQKSVLFEPGEKQKFLIFVKEPLNLQFNFEKLSEINSNQNKFYINFNDSDFVK